MNNQSKRNAFGLKCLLIFLTATFIFATASVVVGYNPDRETIAGIAVYANMKSVVAKLGQPEWKSKVKRGDIAGDKIYSQTFKYPSMGIEIEFWGSKVQRIHVAAPTKPTTAISKGRVAAQTSKGIRIGSVRQDVINAYGDPHEEEGDSITYTCDQETEVCGRLTIGFVNNQVGTIELEGYVP